MVEIEQLKAEKEKLTTEFNNSRDKYKTELTRINTAIRKSQKGAGSAEAPGTNEKRTATSEIERILAVFGASKIKDITLQLNQRGFPQTDVQTVSGILQRGAKTGKRFIKTAPATYALLAVEDKPAEEEVIEQTAGEHEQAGGGDDELEQIL